MTLVLVAAERNIKSAAELSLRRGKKIADSR